MSRPQFSVHQTSPVSELDHLRIEIRQLHALLRRIEQSRRAHELQRRRRIIRIAVTASVIFHILLVLYLAMLVRPGSPGPGMQSMGVEFAILSNEELSEFNDMSLNDLLPRDLAEFDQPPVDTLAVFENASSMQLEAGDLGKMSLLGGAGTGDTNSTLGGGSAGVTFFGVSSRGRRFAYIVDRSGSMGYSNRLVSAKAELIRSIRSLPDYAQFYIIFFSNDIIMPPMQRSWLPANSSIINQMLNWLETVEPMGATLVASSFEHIFNMKIRPEVVFFLTDGQFNDISPERIRDLNRGGSRVVINTIAFGDQSGQNLLRQIASDSGGTYRFVTEGQK